MAEINDYLKREKTKTLQVPMPVSLINEVREEMKKDNVKTWSQFFDACFRSYLDKKKISNQLTLHKNNN